MALRIVYRSYGGENRKGRPPYYSKLLALQSAVRAGSLAGADMVFLNDGPVPADRLALMQEAGRVVQLRGHGMRASYVAALREPRRQGWPDTDLVFFSEDDYLYTQDAFTCLTQAAEAMPRADYFALYGGSPGLPVNQEDPNSDWLPKGWRPEDVLAGRQRWVRIVSTTSSFGVRVGALRQDMSIFLQGLLPHRRSLRDHDTCVVYQGHEPHDWAQLARDITGRGGSTGRERVLAVGLAPFKVALNVRAHRRPEHRRVLMAAAPCLATHLELGWMAPDRDWDAIAAETALWGQRRTEATG